jgi:hypothetical protein
MVSAATVLAAVPPLWPVGAAALATYALATGVEAVRVGREAGGAAIPTVWAIFPVLHASHGIGFAAGLWQYLRKPDWTEQPERVPPRRVALRAV